MGRYVDKPLWEEEVLIVDTPTPVYGGQPEWDASTGRLIDGHSNIPIAILADRTRFLRQEIDSKPTQEEVDFEILRVNGALSSRSINSDDTNVTLTEPEGVNVGQFLITLNNSTTGIMIDIDIAVGTFRTIVLMLKQGTGSNLVEWPTNIHWSSGRPPVLSYTADAVDVVRLVSNPSQADNWFGFFDGAWMA